MFPKVYEKPAARVIDIQPILDLCQSRGAETFTRESVTTTGGWEALDDYSNN